VAKLAPGRNPPHSLDDWVITEPGKIGGKLFAGGSTPNDSGRGRTIAPTTDVDNPFRFFDEVVIDDRDFHVHSFHNRQASDSLPIVARQVIPVESAIPGQPGETKFGQVPQMLVGVYDGNLLNIRGKRFSGQ
jgi:hypothetical protein